MGRDTDADTARTASGLPRPGESDLLGALALRSRRAYGEGRPTILRQCSQMSTIASVSSLQYSSDGSPAGDVWRQPNT